RSCRFVASARTALPVHDGPCAGRGPAGRLHRAEGGTLGGLGNLSQTMPLQRSTGCPPVKAEITNTVNRGPERCSAQSTASRRGCEAGLMGSIPIFVSSTFVDFHHERDVIRGRVRERLDELVATFGHRVEIIDLRSGIEALSHLGQQERHVLDICFDEIDRARPLFLGLVGLRAGLVPEPAHARWAALRAGHDEEFKLETLSITELEISHAALWPTAPIGHHVILLRDLAGPAPHGWSD